ncbi:MAG: MFS transporter [Helicobacteraceae bacterium]|nr:MFS transporter [Helicobacteraceae bacterium]
MNSIFSIKGTYFYLIAMFINAFTDVGHKIIIQNVIFKIYDEQTQIILTAIVNSLIILPFILLFTPSSFIANKYPKNLVMKYSAFFAIIITLLITFCYYNGLFIEAFVLTFVLSAQSAIYSPAKYGYIKELVGSNLISAGNAAVQSITTVAILGSIVFYSFFFQMMSTADTESGILKEIAPLGWLLVIGSIVEYYLASKLPQFEVDRTKSKFNIKKYKNGSYLRKNLKMVTRIKPIFSSIIALGMFWGISQVMLAIFGAYAKDTFHITNVLVVQGILALSAVGIVIGSIVAAKLSKNYIHLGLVPFSAIGMTLMLVLIPFMSSIEQVAVLFITFGFFSGFILVPLNAFIQDRSPQVHLGTILAGNNFLQNIFMFSFLMLTTLFAYNGMDSTILIYLMSFVGLVLFIYMLKEHKLMFAWFMAESLLKVRYKFVYYGLENIPKEGATLLLGNHVSWLDWGIIQFPIERRLRFIIDRPMYNTPFIKPVLQMQDAIPISARGAKDAFKKAREYINKEEVIAIFPEGEISHSGVLKEFHKGFEIIAKDNSGVIIPFYIDGMWGSRLSRSSEKFRKFKTLFRREVRVYYGKPMPFNSTPKDVKEAVEKLKEEHGTK